MTAFKPFLFGLLTGSGIMFVALQYHVVQSHEGFRVVPRTPQHALGLAYADVRNWDAEQWADRPELTRALVAHGSTDLIAKSVADSVVGSVSTENSTLDQLRGFLNESGSETEDDSLFRIPLPSSSDPKNNDSDNTLFTIPFDQDARKKLSTDTAMKPLSSDNGSVNTARSVPPITDVFGIRKEDVALNDRPSSDFTDSFRAESRSLRDPAMPDRSLTSTSTSSSDSSASMTPSQETRILEEMLFGDTETFSDQTTSAQTATSSQTGTGLGRSGATSFEDVTNALQNRAEQAMNRLRESAQQQTSNAFTQSTESAGRYIRNRATESLAPMFGESTSQGSADENLPEALKALRDGFDPFVK
ncbi:MAG: hypothetical protein KDA81_09945 [Planctomycetaceae bacterium]|nr:hypothetical protein [Planctomycetaceae bacterium]